MARHTVRDVSVDGRAPTRESGRAVNLKINEGLSRSRRPASAQSRRGMASAVAHQSAGAAESLIL
jgi:hypothetical protein